jgi:ATP-dependent DNA helicase RecG
MSGKSGLTPPQQEQMVLAYIDKHGLIRRGEVAELCHLSPPQAYRLLKRLKEQGRIRQTGERRYAVYTRRA